MAELTLAALAEEILHLARENRASITTAESCTGGLVAAALTEIAGASDVFDRGFITYSNAAKIALLDVPADLLARHGAVSEPVAGAMAEGARRAAMAGLAVSVTGIAGPGASAHKPEGRVCFGLARADHALHVETCDFGALGRSQVRAAATRHALMLLRQALAPRRRA